MRKIMALLLCGTMLFGGLAACTQNNPDTPTDPDDGNDTSIVTDAASLEYAFNGLDIEGIADSANGFESTSSLTGARFEVNGKYAQTFTSRTSRDDVKIELYNGENTRMVDLSGGVAYTIETSEITVDYTIAKYRTQIKFDDSVLTASVENSNPYMNNSNPWYIYSTEWLLEHLLSEEFYKNQDLTLLNATDTNFDANSSNHNYGDTTTKEGFDIYRYDVKINDDSGNVERPYYNIAVVRKVGDEKNFNLFVMKSKSDKADLMDNLVQSLTLFSPLGIQKNYFNAGTAKEDPNWNEETLEYYRQISTSKTLNWGVFSYSIPGTETECDPSTSAYASALAKSKAMKDGIEEATEYDYNIYPTYTHISWGGTKHYFNTAMSLELAGGNGKNGKPVLQFTYQFTTNNNLVDEQITPMYDIMRGKYDDHFRQLAQDIKAYGKPILFRLNNEMNSDWTSYCGMINLLDPDIFVITWQRLYNIFVEEGVDNVIWIWNPIATSCPYSSWGEDLCYFPGTDYVQLLGATDYEMNNYDAGASGIQSFQERYSALYEKNCASGFENWGVIISEFACGSGGDYSGELGRNAKTQAEWINGMFNEFCKNEQTAYVQQIKGMVWFNCNDYSGTQITNRLRFYEPNSTEYDDLSETIRAFKNGFAHLMAKYGNTEN